MSQTTFRDFSFQMLFNSVLGTKKAGTAKLFTFCLLAEMSATLLLKSFKILVAVDSL